MSVSQDNLIKTGKYLQEKFLQLIGTIGRWYKGRNVVLKIAILVLPLLLSFLLIITPFPPGSTLNNDWNGVSYAADHLRQQGYQVTQIYNSPLELSMNRVPGILIIHHVARSYTTEEIEHLLNLVRNGWGLFIAEELNSELTRALDLRIEAFPIHDEQAFVDDPTQPLMTPASVMNVSSPPLQVFLSRVRPLTLTNVQNPHEVILWSSNQSWIDLDANGIYDPQVDQIGPFPVAIRMTLGQGRIVFMSDFTWLQNQVYLQFDNAKFFSLVLEWLGEAIFNTIGNKPMIYFDESHLSWTTFKPQTFLHAISQVQAMALQNIIVIFLYFVLIAPLAFYQFSTLVDRYFELKARFLKEVKGESHFLQKKEQFLAEIKNPVKKFEILYYKVLLKWLSLDPYFNFNWLTSDPALERIETLTFLNQYLTRLYEMNEEDIKRNMGDYIKTLSEFREKTLDLFKLAYWHEIRGSAALDTHKYEELSWYCYQLALLISKEKKKLI